MSSKRAEKIEQLQYGSFTNSQKSLFLLLYLKKVPWGVKTQYSRSHSRKTKLLIV